MRIYEPIAAEGFEWALPVQDDDFELFRDFDGTPRRSAWSPTRVRLLTHDEDGRPLRPADFPWLGSHVLILRESALRAVGDFLDDYGELLPLECDEADLSVLNVCRIVDALDEEHSVVARFGSGRIMKLESPVFREDVLGDTQIFKVPQMLRGPIYFTQDAVDRIRSAKLAGLDFKLVSGG